MILPGVYLSYGHEFASRIYVIIRCYSAKFKNNSQC